MRLIADLHIHSRFSRACSKDLTLGNLEAWAMTKGIDILATGDFTHPQWFAEIEQELEPAEEGLFRLKEGLKVKAGSGTSGVAGTAPVPPDAPDVRFILSTELSCIYKKGGRTRRIHLVVLAPDREAVRRIIGELDRRGCNLKSDGRPILGLDAEEVVRLVRQADDDCLVIPAHAWTPWFSLFGSESGFDSIEECFGGMTPHIHAIETGLSSDPPMNWRLSALDDIMLVSNSDAHSTRKLGREANVFDLETLGYEALIDVLRKRQRDRLLFTIEFFPEEGKYHADGHRNCGYVCGPEETARQGGIFRHIVPLEEVIADTLGKTPASKAVRLAYQETIETLGSEFSVLLDVPIERVSSLAGIRLAEAISRVREGRISVRPGYDGVFGQVKVFEDEAPPAGRQAALDL
ncbi:hypothetical protein AMJ57_04530 [Parcubacteria bacterium SG8_24]|nr:MAG: hypothetical protein AMJ57_04530 [Parcubacteria bacterium SG8_24]